MYNAFVCLVILHHLLKMLCCPFVVSYCFSYWQCDYWFHLVNECFHVDCDIAKKSSIGLSSIVLSLALSLSLCLYSSCTLAVRLSCTIRLGPSFPYKDSHLCFHTMIWWKSGSLRLAANKFNGQLVVLVLFLSFLCHSFVCLVILNHLLKMLCCPLS